MDILNQRFGITNQHELIIFLLLGSIIAIPAFFGGGKNISGQAVIMILTFPLLFFSWRTGELTLPKILLPFSVFLLIIFLSLLWSPSIYLTAYSDLLWLAYFFIFFAALQYFKSQEKIGGFLYFLTCLAAFLSVIGIYFYLVSENYAMLRLTSTFWWHNAFGGFLIMTIPFALINFLFDGLKSSNNQNRTAESAQVYSSSGTKYLQKVNLITACSRLCSNNIVFWGISSWLLLLALYFTRSRGSWLIFLLIVCAITFIYRQKISKNTLFLAILLLTTLLISVTVISSVKQRQLRLQAPNVDATRQNTEDNAVSARLVYFKDALRIFKDYPLLGTGFGTFSEFHREYRTDTRFYSSDPHNFYLKTLNELGIMGLLAFLFLIFAILRLVYKTIRRGMGSPNTIKTAAVLGIFAALLHIGIDVDWAFSTNVLIFFVLVAGLYSINEKDNLFMISEKSGIWIKSTETILALIISIAGVFIFFAEKNFKEARYAISQKNLFSAEKFYSTAINLNPFNPQYLRERGYFYSWLAQKTGNAVYKEMAKRDFEKALKNNSRFKFQKPFN